MTPTEIRRLQRAIARDPDAADRVFRYLDRHGIRHTRRISGATLARVCGVHPRTWRKWIGGDAPMPALAERVLLDVARV